jgi:hypothetical protein
MRITAISIDCWKEVVRWANTSYRMVRFHHHFFDIANDSRGCYPNIGDSL